MAAARRPVRKQRCRKGACKPHPQWAPSSRGRSCHTGAPAAGRRGGTGGRRWRWVASRHRRGSSGGPAGARRAWGSRAGTHRLLHGVIGPRGDDAGAGGVGVPHCGVVGAAAGTGRGRHARGEACSGPERCSPIRLFPPGPGVQPPAPAWREASVRQKQENKRSAAQRRAPVLGRPPLPLCNRHAQPAGHIGRAVRFFGHLAVRQVAPVDPCGAPLRRAQRPRACTAR